MKRNWELDELIEHFTIMPNEMSLVGNKTGETRLGFAVLLKFFQHEAKFPNSMNEVPRWSSGVHCKTGTNICCLKKLRHKQSCTFLSQRTNQGVLGFPGSDR